MYLCIALVSKTHPLQFCPWSHFGGRPDIDHVVLWVCSLQNCLIYYSTHDLGVKHKLHFALTALTYTLWWSFCVLSTFSSSCFLWPYFTLWPLFSHASLSAEKADMAVPVSSAAGHTPQRRLKVKPSHAGSGRKIGDVERIRSESQKQPHCSGFQLAWDSST